MLPISSSRALLAGAALFAVAAICGGATWAAFSSPTENAGNTVSTAASFANLAVASGSYTGDGVDNRQLSLPFDADVVIVKADTNQIAVMRTSTMTGDAAKPLTGNTALTANLIQSLPAAGFTVGTDTRVNANGTTYRWTAFKSAAANMKVGTYTGDGTASNSITDVGFSPDYTIVLAPGANAVHQKMTGMPRSFNFDANTGITNGLLGILADGFQVGNSAQVNTAGQTYHYVSFAERAGSMASNSYLGDGTNDATVSGAGFQPGYAIVRAADTATARNGHQRPSSLTGSASQFFTGTANSTNGLKAFQADGFQLGTDAAVNASGVTYWYAAFKNSANGCAAPGSQTVVADADAWVEQENPATNKGTDTTLRVTSRSTNRNARTLVSYALPAVPAGCTVTDAALRMRNSSPTAGRTMQVTRNAAAFAEGTVNWTNQPATTGPAATATTTAAAGWLQWSVTAQVQAMYSGGDHGFQVRDATENAAGNIQQQFESREGPVNNRPQLVVTCC